MYSEKTILRNLEDFAAKNGFMPVYHTLAEVEQFKAYINSLIKIESNSKSSYIEVVKPLTVKRQNEIRKWIENEQILCGLDSGYWEKNYAFVCDEKGQIYKFQNRRSQEIFDSVISEFDEKQVSIELLILKARQVGMCLSPDTLVLKADLRWVKIDDLKVGDELVAVDEGQTADERKLAATLRARELRKGVHRGQPKRHERSDRKMRTATVEAKWDTFQTAFKMTFDDGRILVATPSHRWLCRQPGGTDPMWQQTRKIGIGDEVRYVTSPWGPSDYEDGWYGGFLDGEGCMSKPSEVGADVCISQRVHAPLDRAREYLRSRGYNFREEIDNRTAGDSRKLGNEPVHKLFVGRADELFKLMGQTRPSRFISRRWWEGKSLPGKKTGIGWSKVVSIELLAPQRMIDIQTSTKTFIAEGFVSHNSTKTALKFIHRLMFVPHTQAVMASVQADKSELIGRILDTAYNRCPFWLVPQRLPKRAFDNGSILSIQSGMQATGIAQGWTPTAIHISEIADLPNPKKVIEEGLLRATHSSRNLFMVFEGTGGGNTGWLADTWRSSKEDFPRGKARLCPMFIPWAMCPDIYPEADWLRKFPVEGGWTPMEMTRKHVARCESYVRNTPYLAKIAGIRWTMPVEQQWFWEFNYRQAIKNHTQKIWLSQMPADDFEALTGVHDTVFDPEVIAEVEGHVYEVINNPTTGRDIKKRKDAVKSYAIVGHSIEYKFDPDPSIVDHDSPIIDITWINNRNEQYDWQMIPLLPFNEDNETETMDRLLVFQEPQKGFQYSCGVDTAHGLGKPDEERFCGSMTKVADGSGFDLQVAEYTSNRLSPSQAVPFMACAAAWYGQKSGNPRGVKFAIEQVEGPGDTCQNQLKIMGFNWHYTPGRLDGKKIKDENRHREGFYSNRTTVPILMDRFVEAFNGGWYRPKSKYLIEECRSLERHMVAGGRDKMEHQKGKFDDRIRAAAMSYLSSHTYDDLVSRAQKRYDTPMKRRVNQNSGRCNLNSIRVDDDD